MWKSKPVAQTRRAQSSRSNRLRYYQAPKGRVDGCRLRYSMQRREVYTRYHGVKGRTGRDWGGWRVLVAMVPSESGTFRFGHSIPLSLEVRADHSGVWTGTCRALGPCSENEVDCELPRRARGVRCQLRIVEPAARI